MNLNYHISEPSIECPYCDSHYENEGELNDLGEKVELECDNCGKHFWAEAQVSYDTHSDCSLNSIEHDWVNSESHPTVYNCNNCSQYKVERPAGENWRSRESVGQDAHQ